MPYLKRKKTPGDQVRISNVTIDGHSIQQVFIRSVRAAGYRDTDRMEQ